MYLGHSTYSTTFNHRDHRDVLTSNLGSKSMHTLKNCQQSLTMSFDTENLFEVAAHPLHEENL